MAYNCWDSFFSRHLTETVKHQNFHKQGISYSSSRYFQEGSTNICILSIDDIHSYGSSELYSEVSTKVIEHFSDILWYYSEILEYSVAPPDSD